MKPQTTMQTQIPFKSCGLNADWSCEAFHIGPSSEVNKNSGDFYLIDLEDRANGWAVVSRVYFYPNDIITTVFEGNREDAVEYASGLAEQWNQ